MEKHIAGIVGDLLLALGLGGAIVLTAAFPALGIGLLGVLIALVILVVVHARLS